MTNLQRQIVHGSKDVGRPKLESARDRLKDLNPHIHVEGYETRLTSENALAIIERNARAQVQLIDDLLDLSRVLAGQLRLDVQRVALVDVSRAADHVLRSWMLNL